MRVALAQERVSVPFLGLRAIHAPLKDRILRKNLGATGDAGAVVTDDSEAVAREGVSLPLYPGLRDEQVAAVAEAISDYFDHG